MEVWALVADEELPAARTTSDKGVIEMDDAVVVRAWSDESAARCIQRHRRRSQPPPPAPPASAPPAAKAGVPPAYLLIGALLLFGANFALTNLMEESGLTVLLSMDEASPTLLANQTARVLYRAAAVAAAARALREPQGGPLRIELLQRKADGAHAILQVSRRGEPLEAIMPEVRERLRLQPALRLQTVFPERAKWRMSSMALAEGEMPSVGDASLLAQHLTMQVDEDSADAFARAWSDFGYNSLGEAGVVRCDLLRHTEHPHTFTARKVFRSREALVAHEASSHYAAWRAQVDALLLRTTFEEQQLDTIFPAAAPFPFRSPWTPP
uniref:ABM domain-containing protein n=1 Tax=Calcidiscus leptoporus TaxID=127549 RepID=A0A7S0NWY4_9EUKA